MQSRRPQIIVSKIALRPQIAKPVRHECGVFVVSIGEAEPHLPVNVGPQKLFGWKTDTTFPLDRPTSSTRRSRAVVHSSHRRCLQNGVLRRQARVPSLAATRWPGDSRCPLPAHCEAKSTFTVILMLTAGFPSPVYPPAPRPSSPTLCPPRFALWLFSATLPPVMFGIRCSVL